MKPWSAMTDERMETMEKLMKEPDRSPRRTVRPRCVSCGHVVPTKRERAMALAYYKETAMSALPEDEQILLYTRRVLEKRSK